MSGFELQENAIMVFANKQKGGNAPVVTGKANIEGTVVKVAGWRAKEGTAIVGKLSIGNKDEGYSLVGSMDFDDAEKSKDLSPDKLGTLELDKRKFRIALWKKTSKSGTTYLSGTVQDVNKAVKVSGTTPLPTRGDSNALPF